MVSRAASDASKRPRRAQSSSVLLRSTGPIESSTVEFEPLHQHALTAANLAYERANERETWRKEAFKPDGKQETGTAALLAEKPALEKRQSVRFAGPNARPLITRSITQREAPPRTSSFESPRHSSPSQFRDSEASYLVNKESTMAVPEDFGESDIASMSSSYRKLRKAKSMFTPAKTPSAVFADGQPRTGRHFQRHSVQSSDGSGERFQVPDPRLRRSYSFLRGVTDRITTSNRQYATHDAAIQLARDIYLRQLEQQRLKEQPSFLNLGKRRMKRPFRQTVRSSSTNSYGTGIASPLVSVEPDKVGLGKKARSLSQTLKRKIKRVFRKPLDEYAIPAQHLDASHAHYKDYVPLVPEPHAELLRRVDSLKSKEYGGIASVDKGGSPGSIRSITVHSDDEESNDRSRVTNWTNSTAANTLTMPQMMERKRLSMIMEDGDPYQPSSSLRDCGSLRDGYARFRQPMRKSTAGRVAPERIVSALQRKIEENNREAALEDHESVMDGASDTCETQMSMSNPKRTSSIRQRAECASKTNAQLTEGDFIYPTYQQDYAELREGFTPQETAETNEGGPRPSKGPLREFQSAFFPPSMRIERSNTSPFRRALKASSEDGHGFQFDTVATGQPRSCSHVGLNRRRLNGSVAGSESVYSRSPGGHTATAFGSTASLPRSEKSGEAGTAVIITSRPAAHKFSGGAPLERRYSSSDLSDTFKKFMANQVASLSDRRRQHEEIYNLFPGRESGHKRETAQLDGDDVSIGQQQTTRNVPKQPLGLLQGNANMRSPWKHKEPFATVEGDPFMPTNSSPGSGATVQNENNPFRKSTLFPRKSSNPENRKDPSSLVSDLVNGLRERHSHASLTSQRLNEKSFSGVSNVRNSSERTERLRRLRSKSSTSLRKLHSNKETKVASDRCKTPTVLWQQDHGSDDSDASPITTQSSAVGNQKLVEGLLIGRRKEMRISEESGDPAFL